MSQCELAQKLGYRSNSTINKIEKGINDIPQSKISDFARSLETTPEYLLGMDSTSEVLSPSELDLIHSFRQLDHKKQASLKDYISFLQVAL